MFHSRDGLFFARGSTGDVRIIKTSDGKDPREDTEGTNILFMLVLPENEWASVVCSVSKAGETAERWKRARLFHGTEFSELQPSGADETPLPFTAEDKEWLNAPMGPIEEWTPTPTQIANERDQLRAEVERLKKELKLMEHRVITCGVAATHPDANLTRTGAYAKEWDSQQAEQVRLLRARVESLEQDKARLLAVLDRIANCEKDTLSDAHAYTCVREMALCAIDAARGKGAT